MKLSVNPPLTPMDAESVEVLPAGDSWQYEPKWDGFRCLAFRDGREIYLQSKACKPLGRYFPDLVEHLSELESERFVLDGEIVIPVERRLSFETLQLRLHPAESRVRKLAAENPAELIVFDLLVNPANERLLERALRERREELEEFAAAQFPEHPAFQLSPASEDRALAQRWLRRSGSALDGVMAKRLELPYRPGERSAMQKVKNYRSADCVVGGFRYGEGSPWVGSLLLGLYDDDGLLHHVGFTSGFSQEERRRLTPLLEKRIEPPGFTGSAPGGPSRWSTERSAEWKPLKPVLVVEVSYDHFTGGRFRHGVRLLRWRPDKAPDDCRFDQVRTAGTAYALLK